MDTGVLKGIVRQNRDCFENDVSKESIYWQVMTCDDFSDRASSYHENLSKKRDLKKGITYLS